MSNVVTYDCEQCGAEIVVKGRKETILQPIYCCGEQVVKRSSTPKRKIKTEFKKSKTDGKQITKKGQKNFPEINKNNKKKS